MNTPIDISTVVLKTPRLILRPWRDTDLEDFYAYAKVDGVGQMAGWLPHESTEVTRKILDGFIAHKKTFALEFEGKVIGSLGIEGYQEGEYPELAEKQGRSIGYVLSKDYWGRGLMPEAVKAVIAYLFETVCLDFIMIDHFQWNRQSARVIEKCGFEYIRTTTHTTRYQIQETTLEYILYRPERKAIHADT